jgi:cyclase
VNTHHHGDHTHGNSQFSDATIVAHERTRSSLIEAGLWRNPPFWMPFELGDVELEPPSLTYREEVTLWVGDLRCDVRNVGKPAHTTNDSVVWIPERSVLFADDLLFSGGTPFVLMGSLSGSIRVLDEVVKPLGAQTIVLGHGEIGGPELVDDVLGYLRFVWDLAVQGHAAGLPPLEVARQADLGSTATGTTPSASSATSTALTQVSDPVSQGSRWISQWPWATWSPSTAAGRSPVWPDPHS